MTTGSEPSERRLLLRFAIGALVVGRARLIEELRAIPPPDAVEAPAIGIRHPLLGALVSAPAALDAVAAAGKRFAARGARAFRPVSNAGRWIFGSHPMRREVRRLRARVDNLLQRWAILGLAEEAAGRELADVAISRIYDETMTWLGENNQLRDLIHESSAGLTRGVLGDLRKRTATADTRAENMLRRVRRKD